MKTRNLLKTAGVMALCAGLAAGCATLEAPAEAPQLGAFGLEPGQGNDAIDPGDDFFAYANGAWYDSFEIPGDLARYGMFDKLRLDAEEDIRAIVEEVAASNPAPGTLEQKVGDFYGAWMNTDGLEEMGTAPLQPYLDNIFSIKTKDDVMKAYASLHGDAPFGLGIIPDPADTTRYIAFVGQSGLGMPDRDYYLEEGERYDGYRAAYRTYVETLLGQIVDSDVAARADAIIALETKLAALHWTQAESRDIQKIYNPMSQDQLKATATTVNWDIVLAEMGLSGVETFLVAQPSAIKDGAALFDATLIDTLKDYLAFHFVNSNTDFLPASFDDANFEFFSKALRGTTEPRARWKRGIEQVNGSLGEAVGQIYVERHFPADYKAQMEALVGNLTAAFEERLEQNEWMDDETKTQALLKLSTFEPKIGFTDKWTDFGPLTVKPGELLANGLAIREFQWKEQLDRLGGPVDRDRWPYPPQTVNASYNPLLNQITFPAGILQPPFFDPFADAAINYGGIGAVIGHEIGHGFDDQGRRFDEQGRIRDWWTQTANERFEVKTDALGAQYETYEPVEGKTINGELTMGENIGDLGGLQMAYAAYQRYLASCCDGVAPVIDGMTGDQRFFLGWAQVWRAKAREEEIVRRLVTDPHSPPEYRVNGVVRNLDAWYDAFDVSEDDDLYLAPEDRVRIW